MMNVKVAVMGITAAHQKVSAIGGLGLIIRPLLDQQTIKPNVKIKYR